MIEKFLHQFRQSGVIPYKLKNNDYYIMLITSRKNHKWIIPKGIIEQDHTSQQSAEKEALEEAGISGNIFQKKIGKYYNKKWGGICEIEVFAMKVKMEYDKWDEDYRERAWFTLNDALMSIKNEKLRKLIGSLPEFLKSNK